MALEYMTKAGYEALKKELADSLAQRPVAAADSTTVAAAGPLPFAIPTEGLPTLFVSIVASTVPFEAGDELP